MKRATVYFDDNLHQALKIKALQTSSSVSELVNIAVKSTLTEDLDDLEAFRDRESEPVIDFESFLQDLRKDGKV